MSYHPSDATVQVQTTSNYFALIKAANTVGYFSLVYLTWRFLTHHLDWQLSTGCVVISGSWLALTRIKVDHLLQTYFDVLSRIELELPVLLGISTSVVALFAHALHPIMHVLALAEIAGWTWIFFLFKANQALFKKQGYGPVPIQTWVDPPASVLKPCDLILTSGNVAKGLHETVGHAEVVLKMPDGKMMLLSSNMDKGANLHPLEEVTGPSYKGHYVALHLATPMTESKEREAAEIAVQLVQANKQWAEKENAKLSAVINWLPLPQSTKASLRKTLHVTGYDWFGMFMGRVAKDHWTCIGAALELYHRMGITTNQYGTGLFGFGTTLFDPILPVRFLADPAFDLITTDAEKAEKTGLPTMDKTAVSLNKNSRFILKLSGVEALALLPFIAKIFEGRVIVFWSHYGLKPYFFGALCLYAIGIILALLIKNRSLGLVVAAILSLPFFALPFFEMAIITSMPGF